MPDQTLQSPQNTTDELDEILVKEPDGTFRIVKVQPGQAPQASTTGSATIAPKPVMPPPPLARVEKPAPATMVLGNEEEKELALVAEKTKTIAPAQEDKSQATARRAIAQADITLSDPSLASRLLAALVALVKEVRKELETRDLLMRPKERGGLGMTIGEATRLLSLLKNPNQPQTPLPPPSKPVASQAPTVQATKLIVPPSQPQPLTSPSPMLLARRGEVSFTSRSIVQAPKPIPLPPAPKPVTPPAPRPAPLPPIQEMTRPPTETKQIVQDVTFTPKLSGPIDELQMSLSEWRRMAPTLKDRGIKIEEKLRLLEEESYAERLKGVAAWYASDVVRLYQDAGRESLASGKPVASILSEREAAGKPSFSLEEFQSIAELNERLRF